MIKKITLILFVLYMYPNIYAQMGIGIETPDQSSVLDITASNKGVLMPRLTTDQRNAIKTPSDGLIVYDTTESRLFHYNIQSAEWEKISTQTDVKNGGGTSNQKAKNIIFMIGDGMSMNQIYAAYTRNGKNLTLTTFPFTGIVQTFSADNFTTDSAAGGTALSSGVKTKNGYVGVDAGGNAVPSIIAEAKSKGFSTGIVVTSSVTHATPASFYAHQLDRNWTTNIANDFLVSNVDVCIGGGKSFFTSTMLNSLTNKGYQVVYDLNSVTSNSNKILALLANDGMPKVSEGRGEMLSQATQKALNILKKNEKGFFLMVEGSQIDWGGHNKDGEYMINEMLDFDKAIKIARDFAQTDGNTLVVVTADHETGGLIVYGSNGLSYYYTNTIDGNHTAVPVPVFAFGPGGNQFTGFFDNTEFKGKFQNLLGF